MCVYVCMCARIIGGEQKPFDLKSTTNEFLNRASQRLNRGYQWSGGAYHNSSYR